MEDRERFEEVKRTGELQACCFTLGSSNSRMVQLYTSKQMDAKGMLTIEQYELARTLYMQWLRKANNIVQLPSSPRKKQKMGGPSLFRCASLVEDLEGSPAAHEGFDPVTDEILSCHRREPSLFFVSARTNKRHHHLLLTTVLILSQTRLNCGSDSRRTASVSLLTKGHCSTSSP